MSTILVLDTNTLGLVTTAKKSEESEKCRQWLETAVSLGARVTIPQTAYEEVMKGLLHERGRAGVESLNKFIESIGERNFIRNCPSIDVEGKRLQDYSQKIGWMTGSPDKLSPDCVIAASARLAPQLLEGLGKDARAVVVTDNIKHFHNLVECYKWTDLTVSKLNELRESKEPWQPPQREGWVRKDAKVMLDRGIEEYAFREGMPRYEVVSIDRMKDVGNRNLNGAELVQTARERGFEAVITTNWGAIEEADRKIGEKGKPVYLLTLNVEPMKDQELVKKAMPDIERDIREGIEYARKRDQGRSY